MSLLPPPPPNSDIVESTSQLCKDLEKINLGVEICEVTLVELVGPTPDKDCAAQSFTSPKPNLNILKDEDVKLKCIVTYVQFFVI